MTEPEEAGKSEEPAKVFLSYSRKDRERAQSIADVLRERHFGVFKDTDDILPTEEWKGRLEQLIHEADTIVFLLSPHSVASEVCAWEVEYATSLNKRVAPIVIDEVEGGDIPPLLARLNFIFCTERDRFQDAVDNLVSALNTDIEWIREHTRLAGLAQRWEAADRPARLLLRGQDIGDAEQWRDTRPADAPDVTGSQAAFIGSSRAAATRRQRLTVAFSLAGLVLAVALAGFAYLQREAAIENERQALINEQRAIENEEIAESARNQAVEQRDAAQMNQSLLLTQLAESQRTENRPVEAALLALEALPDSQSANPLRRDRPLVDEAFLALGRAEEDTREVAIIHAGSEYMAGTLSPDQRLFAVHAPEDGEVVIYDLREGKILRRVPTGTENRAPREPAFSTDGTMVVAAGASKELLLIPTQFEVPVQRLALEYEHPRDLAFVKSGSAVAFTIARTGTRIVRVEDGKEIGGSNGQHLAISRDGKKLALAEKGKVQIYNADTLKRIGQSTNALKGPLKPADQLKFSPDGRWLAAAAEHKTWILDGTTGELYGATPDRELSLLGFGFSPDSQWYFITGTDGRTLVYDVEGKQVASEHAGPDSWIFDADIAPDRKTAITAGAFGEMQVWNPVDNKVLARLFGHEDAVKRVWLIDEDARALSQSDDGTVRIWNLPTPPAAPAKSLVEGFQGDPVVSPDGTVLALSEAGIFDMRDGTERYRTRREKVNVYKQFSADGEALLALIMNPANGDRPDVCLIDPADGAEIRCMLNSAEGNIWSAHMDGAATTIAANVVANKKRYIQTFDAASGTLLGSLLTEFGADLPSDRGQFSDPHVLPDGQQVLMKRNDAELAIFDRTMSRQNWYRANPFEAPKVIIAPDARTALFFDANTGDSELIDTASRDVLARYRLDLTPLAKPVFSQSGRFLLTRNAAGDRIIRNARSGEILLIPRHEGSGQLQHETFARDDTLFIGSQEASTIVWDLKHRRKVGVYEMDFAGTFPSVFAKGVFDEGRTLVTWGWQGPQEWRLRADVGDYVADIQSSIPRCLSASQRRNFFLPPEPPRWCITGPGKQAETDPANWTPKWPYHTTAWRDWQIKRDAGESPVLPE